MVDAELPIDIPSTRLVEWLVERQLLKAKWRSKCKALQLKVAELKAQLPQDMQGGEANYQSARSIRESLIATAEKNFLGYYKGEAGIWDKLVRAYEAENVYVGEAAFTLGRNVEFEIPFLRAQMVKHQQQLMDNERRQGEYSKSAANAQSHYAQECTSLGIEGKNVVGELQQLTKSLPQLLFDAVAGIQSRDVEEAVQYYQLHVAQIQGEPGCTPAGQESELLPTLAEARSAPLELPASEQSLPQSESTDAGAHPPLDDQGGDRDEGGISWVETDAGEGLEDGEAAEIDWDFDAGGASQEEDPSLVVPADPTSPDSDGNIVTRLAADGNFRNMLMVDLSELLAFLQQRQTELSSTSTHLGATANAPDSLQQYTLATVQELRQAVGKSKQALTDSHLAELLSLASSCNAFDRTTNNLIQKASQEAKFYRLRKELELKMQELQAKLVEDASRVKALGAESNELKAFVEEQLASLLKGRKARITGEFSKS